MPEPAWSLDLAGARDAAAADRTAEWVGAFLCSEGSDNAALAAALAERRHWWCGPVRVPLDQLVRLAGPADEPVLCPVDPAAWAGEVEAMETELAHGWSPPPLLAECQDGRLLLQDGNHRYAALREAGAPAAWVLVYFDDEGERDRWQRERSAPTR